MTITLRAAKGSALTHGELDGNFTHLQTTADAGATAAATTYFNSRVTIFESAESACPTSSATIEAVHPGPSEKPFVLRVVLRCKTADGGYVPGSEVDVTHTFRGDIQWFSTWISGTRLGWEYQRGGNPPAIQTKGAPGSITTVTAANWKVVFYAMWVV